MNGGHLLAAHLGVVETIVSQVELADLCEQPHEYEQLFDILRLTVRVAVLERNLIALHQRCDRLADRFVYFVLVLEIKKRS